MKLIFLPIKVKLHALTTDVFVVSVNVVFVHTFTLCDTYAVSFSGIQHKIISISYIFNLSNVNWVPEKAYAKCKKYIVLVKPKFSSNATLRLLELQKQNKYIRPAPIALGG